MSVGETAVDADEEVLIPAVCGEGLVRLMILEELSGRGGRGIAAEHF